MSVSEEFVEYVLDLLGPLGRVETSRMFGGVLLKVDGKQLGVVLDDTLYFKVIDVKLQEKYKDLGSKQFSYTRKDKKKSVVIKNWWSVPEQALDNGEEMTRLAGEVLEQ